MKPKSKMSVGEREARAQLASIVKMVENLGELATEQEREEASEIIRQDPLSVEVRSGWHKPDDDARDKEFQIMLSVGGPAVRLIGTISNEGTPCDYVRLEWREWGIPWTELPVSGLEFDALLAYAGQFYFGALR